MNMLERVIDDETYNQRNFSYLVKEELFHEKPYCAISGQRILVIEDAEVDHIIPYAKGGQTQKQNAQLVLRYFNRSKQDKLGD